MIMASTNEMFEVCNIVQLIYIVNGDYFYRITRCGSAWKYTPDTDYLKKYVDMLATN